MGNKCCNKKKTTKKIVLLLVGLDNSGKTVAAKGLAGEPLDTVVPTVGFSVINLKYLDYKVKVFDLGGGSDIRGIWHRYFVDAHGVIFVVDSSDFSRLDEAKLVLQQLLSHEKISGKPVLVLANKQDQQNALDEIDLVEKLQIEPLVNQRQCPTLVESCSATDITSKSKLDPGIKKGYRWLLNYIVRDFQQLNKRVVSDVEHQETIDHQARLEKMERLRALNERKRNQDVDAIELFSEYNKKVNGIPPQIPQEPEIFRLPQPFSASNSEVSVTSDESLSHVYHTNLEDAVRERPKSAVQIVKEQLELNGPQRRFKNFISNKTTPVNLYGVRAPQSAKIYRKVVTERRNLKSAGDSVLIVGDLPNSVLPGPDKDDLHQRLFELNNFQRGRKLPPLKQQKQENGLPSTSKPCSDISSLSVIDID